MKLGEASKYKFSIVLATSCMDEFYIERPLTSATLYSRGAQWRNDMKEGTTSPMGTQVARFDVTAKIAGAPGCLMLFAR